MTRLTNEQKAARLDILAAEMEHADNGAADAALLRECAAIMRERNPDDALWEVQYERRYKRYDLCVCENFDGKWRWTAATRSGLPMMANVANSLPAAQAAAVAWCDSQEGK